MCTNFVALGFCYDFSILFFCFYWIALALFWYNIKSDVESSECNRNRTKKNYPQIPKWASCSHFWVTFISKRCHQTATKHITLSGLFNKCDNHSVYIAQAPYTVSRNFELSRNKEPSFHCGIFFSHTMSKIIVNASEYSPFVYTIKIHFYFR